MLKNFKISLERQRTETWAQLYKACLNANAPELAEQPETFDAEIFLACWPDMVGQHFSGTVRHDNAVLALQLSGRWAVLDGLWKAFDATSGITDLISKNLSSILDKNKFPPLAIDTYSDTFERVPTHPKVLPYDELATGEISDPLATLDEDEPYYVTKNNAGVLERCVAYHLSQIDDALVYIDLRNAGYSKEFLEPLSSTERRIILSDFLQGLARAHGV